MWRSAWYQPGSSRATKLGSTGSSTAVPSIRGVEVHDDLDPAGDARAGVAEPELDPPGSRLDRPGEIARAMPRPPRRTRDPGRRGCGPRGYRTSPGRLPPAPGARGRRRRRRPGSRCRRPRYGVCPAGTSTSIRWYVDWASGPTACSTTVGSPSSTQRSVIAGSPSGASGVVGEQLVRRSARDRRSSSRGRGLRAGPARNPVRARHG